MQCNNQNVRNKVEFIGSKQKSEIIGKEIRLNTSGGGQYNACSFSSFG